MSEAPRRRRSLVNQIEESACSQPEQIEEVVGPDPANISEDRLIPSGVTILNCACSDNPFGAFAFGSINTIPGKSASGKTELMLTMLACCAIDKKFDDYDLILDDAEQTMSFNLEYLFPPLVGRLKSPRFKNDCLKHSVTIEDFEASLIMLLEKSKNPFIYVLDSLDS